MKIKLYLGALLLALLSCMILPTQSFAASAYDDLVEKATTEQLINYVDNFYGKTCGSPTDDYAERWLYAFKQQNHNDLAYHADAVASLETAMSSPDGAYAIKYEQKNNHDNTSNPYFLKVYWTEHDKDDFETIFGGVAPTRYLSIQQKPGSTAKLRTADIASPSLVQGGSLCNPEFLWGYQSSYDVNSVSFGEASSPSMNYKLFVSTFDVTYPAGYSGPAIPDQDPAIGWFPTTSAYDDLMEQITTDNLINNIDDYYGASCGSAATDYSATWLDAFKRQDYNNRSYHPEAVASLEYAMADGEYAIRYEQVNNNDNSSNPYFITVYWIEDKSQFEAKFTGEAPNRTLSIARVPGSSATLHSAVIASPKLVQAAGSCEAEFLWGYQGYSVNGVSFGENTPANKLFKSTFNVVYPEGYAGVSAPGNPTELDYLALGDSYSSGEGDTEKNHAINQKYYRPHTDVEGDTSEGIPREKCHISTRSYPYRLAAWMQLSTSGLKQWDTIACSGAAIYDANQANKENYEGQWGGEGDPGLGRLHGLSDKDTLQAIGLNEIIPGRNKQIEFVEKYQPKVITLTMGGNDVGFASKVEACVGLSSPGTCNFAKLEWRNKLKNELRDQYDNLVALYEELKSASNSGTKIYVLGYPQFINGDPSASCQSTFNLDSNEREMIVNSVTYFNNVIEQAAKAAGIKYIDIETAFGDHRLCDEGEKHVTAITNIFGANGNEVQESFHPNAKGHKDIAEKVKQEVSSQSLLVYDACPNTAELSCPDASAIKATIPSTTYFTITDEDEDKKFVHYQLSSGELVKSSGQASSPLRVMTQSLLFQSASSVEATIYSDPVSLGTIQTGADGSIDQDLSIPADIPAGYHTLVLSGKTNTGEDIETYQTILIKGSDPNDIDENSTPDSQQACGAFIEAASEDADFDGIDDACDPLVTEPILYAARNGDTTRGEDPDKIYLFRNVRASSITGVTNDYVDTSPDPNNKEALVAASLDAQTESIFNKFIMLEDTSDPSIKIPTILAKDTNNTCFALQAKDYRSPALNPTDPNYQPRGFTTLTQLPEGESCE